MDTEREKMLRGDYYLSSDPELVSMRLRARLLLERYNTCTASNLEERARLLAELFGARGKSLHIEPPFFCDYGVHIRFGEDVFINTDCKFLDICQITIGHRVLMGPNVQVYAASHPLDAELRRRGLELGRSVTIGDDCWIGGSAVFLPGVQVGARTVVGAGSVVTRDIPSDVLVVGNPARIVKHLGTATRIEAALDSVQM